MIDPKVIAQRLRQAREDTKKESTALSEQLAILDAVIDEYDEIINKLLKIRSKRNKPFFDDKTQLDLNCLWISSLVAAHDILPDEGYLKLAEEFLKKNQIESAA